MLLMCDAFNKPSATREVNRYQTYVVSRNNASSNNRVQPKW